LDEFKREVANSIGDAIETTEGKLPYDKISVVIHSKNKPKLEPNVMLFQAFSYLAATELKPSTCKTLFYLFSLSQWENYLSIDIKTIAEELKITERSVLNAIKELKENNILLVMPHPSDKRRNDYFLNPLASWKGNSFTRRNKLQQIPKNQLSIFSETWVGFDGTQFLETGE
jgi:hypothetical protein